MKVTNNVYKVNVSIKTNETVEAFDKGFLAVSSLHKLWYAQYGNKNGVPVLVVHGGPGGGCNESVVTNFDLDFYRVILLDQRGAGKSQPFAEIAENNTAELIEDIEKLRKHLAIDKWLLCGGSWGSALSLLYGEKFPDRCLGFILRGIFLATEKEKLQLWYGMKDTYPEYWDEMVSMIPIERRGELDRVFLELTTDADKNTQNRAACAFMKYDLKAASIFERDISDYLNNAELLLAVTRIFSHYSVNNFFVDEKQIINNIAKINHLPLIIVHGRHDNICKPIVAYNLYKNWPGAKLHIVQDGGHTGDEIGILLALREAIEEIKYLI